MAFNSTRPRAPRYGYTSGTGRSIARAIASATSSASCRGPAARVACPDSRFMTSKNSVSVETGNTTVTLMAEPWTSERRHSARPTCANFVAAYAPM